MLSFATPISAAFLFLENHCNKKQHFHCNLLPECQRGEIGDLIYIGLEEYSKQDFCIQAPNSTRDSALFFLHLPVGALFHNSGKFPIMKRKHFKITNMKKTYTNSTNKQHDFMKIF